MLIVVKAIDDEAINDTPALKISPDLTKALDKIKHCIMLDKLYHHNGIRGVACYWLANCLSNRTQQVQCLDRTSCTRKLSYSSVPRDSMVGPLLFMIYIYDLTNSLKHSCNISFLDNTTIFDGQNHKFFV